MPGEGKPSSPLDKMIYANGRDHWAPDKYERFGLYVFLYNYVRANLDDFAPQPNGQPSKFKDDSGNYINFELDRTALSTQINDAIYKHYDWFVKHLHLDEPISLTTDGRDLGIKRETFLSEFYDHAHQSTQIMQMNSELGGPLKGNGTDKSNMSTDDLLLLLRHKEDNVRKYFDNVRNAVEGKPRDLDENGKPKGGYLTVDMTKALQEKDEFTRQLLEGAGSSVFYGIVSAGGIGLTAVSVMGIFSYGGLALPSLLGAAFVASPVGMAAVSAIGLVAGIKITKATLGKFTGSLGKEFGKLKDYFHFMVGMGKYAPKDGIPRGFLARRERYETGLELKTVMTKFQIPHLASEFDKAFDAFFDETVESSKYLKHFTDKELRELKKNTRYTYQVTNGLAEKQGASLFGRLRGLVSAEYPTERIDYKFDNADEANRHFKARLNAHQTGKPSLGEVKKDLEWLDANKSFFENAKREDLYKNLMSNYKEIILNTVDKIAFDEPIKPNTIVELQSALDNPVLGDRIKSDIRGAENKMKAVISFLEKENTERNIDLNLNANVQAQLTFSAPVILDACTGDGFGPHKVKDPTMLDAVKVASEFIDKYKEQDKEITISGKDYKLDDIKNLIYNEIGEGATYDPSRPERIVPNSVVYNYLTFMLEKKERAAVYTKDGILSRYCGATVMGAPSENLIASPTFDAIKKSCTDVNPDILTLGTKLDTIINAIHTCSGRNVGDDEFDRIFKDIDALDSKYIRQKEYLTYLLKRTPSNSRLKGKDYVEIVSDISNLRVSDLSVPKGKIDRIKQDILKSELPSATKGNLIEALSKQTSQLENLRENTLVQAMLAEVRNGNCQKFEEVMNKITSLSFDQVTGAGSEETNRFLTEEIGKMGGTLTAYFSLKFRQKVEALISQRLLQESTQLTGKEGLDKNAEYLKLISDNRFLDDVQKQGLFAEVAGYLEQATVSTISSMQQDILGSVERGENLTSKFRDYQVKPYQDKGLKEFFDEGTTQSETIKTEIETFQNIADFGKYISPVQHYGGLHNFITDKGSNDSVLMVSAFFDNPNIQRTNSDKLFTTLKSISEAYGTQYGLLLQNDNKGIDDYFNKVNGIVGNWSDPFGTSLCATDKLAALLDIKKHALEAFKYHVWISIGGDINIRNITEANKLIANDDFQTNVCEVWKKYMRQIDDACMKLLNSPEVKSSRWLIGKDSRYIPATTTVSDFCTQAKLITEMQTTSQSQPGA